MFKLLILASEQNQISTWKSFTPSIDFIFMACTRTASKDNDYYDMIIIMMNDGDNDDDSNRDAVDDSNRYDGYAIVIIINDTNVNVNSFL